ncbi:hypothetical protein J5N97_028244 [Dioscorea zingiberensis]|uniref:Uncharacterized protein n=1 Tax=Dioscorea zingiberensis TaxID=325984 RepID=A0A9D5H4Q2_9LILI|nr:hypothetical protein J5N97_028244 [Dioscorea zingiberensis]
MANPQDLSHALYLLGGSLNVIPSSAIQVFDATTSQWSLGPPISTAREFSSTAVLTGQIYSSGRCPRWEMVPSPKKPARKMAMFFLALSLTTLLGTASMQGTAAVTYQARNNAGGTAGGTRFDNEIGLDYSTQVLSTASSFIWTTFQQDDEASRKNVQVISLIIENMDGVAYTSADQIHVSASYIAGYSGDVKTEITGVLYHEVVHVWQWNGQGAAPGGLIEGIADYVRLKAGFAPSHWVQPGQGDRWDQGYDVTARFLDYLNGLKDGFVALLNAKMKDGYSDQYFVDLLGKTVDQLWSDYKAQYGG